MSKLIVEIVTDMPNSCDVCPFVHENDDLFSEDYRYLECGFPNMGMFVTDYITSRHPDCPICGVLPDEHGDLIDKETAKNAFDSSFLTFRMKDGETMRSFYQRTIDELPVLIAAERKDDGK